jgi:hypothetical protein
MNIAQNDALFEFESCKRFVLLAYVIDQLIVGSQEEVSLGQQARHKTQLDTLRSNRGA